MAISTATRTFSLSDYLGDNYDPRRTKVYATTNLEKDRVVDKSTGKFYLGSGSVVVSDTGQVSLTVPTPGADSNPASWQTTVVIDFGDKLTRERDRLELGPFTITSSGLLSALVDEQEVPPTYLTAVTQMLDGKVASAETERAGAEVAKVAAETAAASATEVALGDAAAVLASAIVNDGPVKTNLSNTIATALDALGPVVDRVITATVSTGTYTADLDEGDVFVLTLTGNATLAATGLVAGRSFVVKVIQDTTGGRVLTLPAASGTVTLDTTANTYERIVYSSDDGQTLDAVKVPGPVSLPFNPTMLPNGVLLLDPQTIEADPTQPVPTVTNGFPGKAEIIPSASAGSKPTMDRINSVNVLDFDGSDFMACAETIAAQPFTMVALVKLDSATPALLNTIMSKNSGTAAALGAYPTTGTWWMDGGSAKTINGAALSTDWKIVVAVFNGVSSKMRVDGAEVTGDAGVGALSTGIYIGTRGDAARWFSGLLGYAIVLDKAATTDELADIEAYLSVRRAAIVGA